MSSTSPSLPHLSDWSRRTEYNWNTLEGIDRLRTVVRRRVPYEPSDFQLQNTAKLLSGQDVLCISATGDGKSALLYMYPMVREDTITIVISPTNALESDLKSKRIKLRTSM